MSALPLKDGVRQRSKTVYAPRLCLTCGKPFTPTVHTYKRQKLCSLQCSYVTRKFTPEQREAAFWRKVNKESPKGCWIFQGCKDKWGYGHMSLNGKRYQAHRFAYEMARGTIPPGKLILHSCDVPYCVNPAHLRVGTDADNVADKVARTPHKTITRAKLTEAQVKEIRSLYKTKKSGDKIVRSNAIALGKRYGVSKATISHAALGLTWKHL